MPNRNDPCRVTESLVPHSVTRTQCSIPGFNSAKLRSTTSGRIIHSLSPISLKRPGRARLGSQRTGLVRFIRVCPVFHLYLFNESGW